MDALQRNTHCNSLNPKRKESERVRSEGTEIGAEITGKMVVEKVDLRDSSLLFVWNM